MEVKKEILSNIQKKQENIQFNDNLTPEEKIKLSLTIIDDMINNVSNLYSNRLHHETNNVALSQQSQDTPLFLSEIIKHHNGVLLEKKNINNEILQHLEVHKQFVVNLCGYYALFNLVQAGKLLRAQDLNKEYLIKNPAAFWKFHFETTSFLNTLAIEKNYDRTRYPWDWRNIRWGDLERTYMNNLLKYHTHLHKLFESNESFYSRLATLEFQYDHFVSTEQNLLEVQTEIDHFINAQPKGNMQHCLFLMLGVTNHWVSFLAYKSRRGVEYFYFDSRNRSYISWDENNLEKRVDEWEIERNSIYLKPWTKFQKEVNTQFVKDIQSLTRLLILCFKGETNLVDFKMKMYEMLLWDFQDSLDIFKNLSVEIKNGSKIAISDAISIAGNYYANIEEFFIMIKNFGNAWNYLSSENKKKIKDTLDEYKEAFDIFFDKVNIWWVNKLKYHFLAIKPLFTSNPKIQKILVNKKNKNSSEQQLQ